MGHWKRKKREKLSSFEQIIAKELKDMNKNIEG
jgi:hypothetical protein